MLKVIQFITKTNVELYTKTKTFTNTKSLTHLFQTYIHSIPKHHHIKHNLHIYHFKHVYLLSLSVPKPNHIFTVFKTLRNLQQIQNHVLFISNTFFNPNTLCSKNYLNSKYYNINTKSLTHLFFTQF